MKRALNPNAGEFHPTGGGLNALGSFKERDSRSSSLKGSFVPATASPPQHNTANPIDTVSFFSSDGNVEACHFIPVTRSLVECRAAFYEHSESTRCKHMEFERLLRLGYFGAHEANELSISSASVAGEHRAFWFSYSTAYFRMAHDVVQELELGTPLPANQSPPAASAEAASTAPGSVPNVAGFTSDVAELQRQREFLREAYLSKLRPLVPYSIRKQLALRAKRASAVSHEDVLKAVNYALDIFFLFTRLQFLRFLDASSGLSYSACVQFLAKLRERLLKSEVAEPFLSVGLVLMLISTVHIKSAQRAVETASSETNFLRLKVQWLFCTYFPSLVVAFLAGSPLQSVEELRHAFLATNQDDFLPMLRDSPAAIAAIQQLISYNNKTATLWSVTLGEVVNFVLQHLAHTDRAKHRDSSVKFLLAEPTALDDYLHVRCPTVLASLLDSANAAVEEKNSQDVLHPEGELNERSKEFHALAMKSASASGGSEYETVYFSLLTLANMGCFTATELSWLMAALEDSYIAGGHASAMDAFLSSIACASLTPTAHELLDVLRALMRGGHKPLQLQALMEFRSVIEGQTKQVPPEGTAMERAGEP
ncbi:uncharacterized protein Tco025E_06982 [Trypanosoma conorhini]|uniref:Uncharacterized protein n=1 Tax=Trypanosoma conorhini TaxID=83891 RepID=A0A422NVF1_9TRYP|nr:uncharacterized protein Tco025E_06982 [Trypanosoma conorhini]RNF09429.1 hypothetical protein Tco025E_06982 [Trypanosoma conorhini]